MNNSHGSRDEVAKLNKKDVHISVCFCTYKRPLLLSRLLDGLMEQETEGLFSYSIVVVDNDPNQSAKTVVKRFMDLKNIDVSYFFQPEKGLSYARNMSIDHSKGDYIAILDDDELPEKDWLLQLYKCLKKYKADAVFGSVIPDFEVEPPEWVINRKYFYWRDFKHETGILAEHCATNNVLFNRKHINKYDLQFDHDFAFIGGEDEAFFRKLKQEKPDARFITCKEAKVFDKVTADRCQPDYIKKRLLLEGYNKVFSIRKFHPQFMTRYYRYIKSFTESFLRLIVLGILVPILYIFKYDVAKELHYRSYYHISIISALFNFSHYKSRKSIGIN